MPAPGHQVARVKSQRHLSPGRHSLGHGWEVQLVPPAGGCVARWAQDSGGSAGEALPMAPTVAQHRLCY